MRRFALLAATALLAVPALSMADSSSTTAKNDAVKQCRSERKAMGSTAFKQAYGTNKNRSNAFGKCVSHRTRQNSADEHKAHTNAAQECKAERDDATFAENHGGKTFAEYYGTGNGHNAYGRCVSAKAKAKAKSAEKAQVDAEKNAAKACRAERHNDPDKFKTDYGTKRNAFGKCVSKKAKAQEGSDGNDIS